MIRPLILALCLSACATLPPPDSLTPEQRVSLCANLATAAAEVERAFGDPRTSEEAIALTAFRLQLAEERERYSCQ